MKVPEQALTAVLLLGVLSLLSHGQGGLPPEQKERLNEEYFREFNNYKNGEEYREDKATICAIYGSGNHNGENGYSGYVTGFTEEVRENSGQTSSDATSVYTMNFLNTTWNCD